MKLRKSSTIQTNLGTYYRALETANHIYYANFEESDENASIKMYNRKRELVSDNYFAYCDFIEMVNTGDYTWATPKLKKLISEKVAVIE
jgi:hypothetical protein